MKICLFVSKEYTNVTDRRTDTARMHRSRFLHSIAQKKSQVAKITAGLTQLNY